MPEKKKQHYVPRFYLKFFSDEVGKSINLYNIKSNRKISNANLYNQCYEPYFYGKNLVVENAFESLEGVAAEVIESIKANFSAPKRFSDKHHAILTYSLLQYARTKYSAEANDEFTDKLIKSIFEKDQKYTKEELEKVKISNNDPIGLPLKTMAQSIPIAMDLHLKVLINKTNINFITSDNPVVFYNQACEHSDVGSSTGLASKGLQIIFPLSPKHILIFYDSKVYKIGAKKHSYTDVINENDIFQLNDLQWLNALENIYYDNNQKNSEILRGAKRNISKRHKNKSLLNEYPGQERSDGKESVLLLMHKPDLKIGLKIHCIKKIRDISDSEIYDGSKSVRDLQFIQIHRKFLVAVDEGKYNTSEFVKFINELS